MKAIIITHPGGPEVLQAAERPIPAYTQNEVLVKVMAAGVNRPDIAQRKGNYPPPKGAPADIPGLELAGIVIKTGAHVTRWKAGDRVCALVTGGAYAEYCNVPEGQCLPIPTNLSFEEAASLPETFFTVWSNVFDRGGLLPGESLLVHGGSSGIGVAAIQMAKAFDSKVLLRPVPMKSVHFAKTLGADKAINYNRQDFNVEVLRLTSNKGADVILDMIGGDYTPLNISCLADDGRLVMINTSKGKDVQIDLSAVMRKRLVITGSTLRSRNTALKVDIAKKLEERVWTLLVSGQIKPVIDRIFNSDEAALAHKYMESSKHMGKIVLRFAVGS